MPLWSHFTLNDTDEKVRCYSESFSNCRFGSSISRVLEQDTVPKLALREQVSGITISVRESCTPEVATRTKVPHSFLRFNVQLVIIDFRLASDITQT